MNKYKSTKRGVGEAHKKMQSPILPQRDDHSWTTEELTPSSYCLPAHCCLRKDQSFYLICQTPLLWSFTFCPQCLSSEMGVLRAKVKFYSLCGPSWAPRRARASQCLQFWFAVGSRGTRQSSCLDRGKQRPWGWEQGSRISSLEIRSPEACPGMKDTWMKTLTSDGTFSSPA